MSTNARPPPPAVIGPPPRPRARGSPATSLNPPKKLLTRTATPADKLAEHLPFRAISDKVKNRKSMALPLLDNSCGYKTKGIDTSPVPRKSPRQLSASVSPGNLPSKSPVISRVNSDSLVKTMKVDQRKRFDSANTSPFRTWKRMLELTIAALGVADVPKARIEEAIFTSPGFMSLKDTKSITLKQEQDLLSILRVTDYLLANNK